MDTSSSFDDASNVERCCGGGGMGLNLWTKRLPCVSKSRRLNLGSLSTIIYTYIYSTHFPRHRIAVSLYLVIICLE